MNNTIENLRKVTGTLPSETPKRQTQYLDLQQSIEIELIDYNANPYKAMFCAATSTWSNNKFENKWNKTYTEAKLEVIKAVLLGYTLPQPREMVNFLFRVKGVPRWLFDYSTQHTPFASWMSIGCRDNNKIDCDFVFLNEQTNDEQQVFESLKDLYEDVLNKGKGSWQSARTFLPQSYSHAYHFSQNLLSMSNMKFEDNEKGKQLKEVYWHLFDSISLRFPLIGTCLFKRFFVDSKNAYSNFIKNELDINLLNTTFVDDLKLFEDK